MNKLIIAADSTQIESFLQCERLWNYSHRERLGPLGAGAGDALMMGTYGHKLLEIYYKSQSQECSQTKAMEQALAFDPDRETCSCGHTLARHTAAPDFPERNGSSSLCVDCSNEAPCNNFIPVPFALEKPNRAQVQQRFREYCYTYTRNDLIPQSPEHVEVGFSELIYEDSEKMYILEGRVDLIGSYQGLACVADHKFQLRERALFKKAIQFRNYAMVAHKNLMILNMIRLAKNVTTKTFERPLAQFTEMEHQWWRQELIKIFHRMSTAVTSATFTPNWSTCSGRFGYECDFTALCEPGERDPELIAAKKQTLYQIKPEWRPW